MQKPQHTTLSPAIPIALWRRFRRWYLNYVSWPIPLWRLKGSVPVSLGGYPFRFCVVSETCSWANVVRINRWEAEGLAYLRNNVRPGDQFVDIGAWVGPYALLASRLVEPTGRVYAIEPDPVARAALERNIAENSAPNISVIPWAVTEQRGMIDLDVSALGDSRTKVRRGKSGHEVASVTLDEFCDQEGLIPSVIKIDVEGAETRVFAGGKTTLRRARAVILEFHQTEIWESGMDPSLFWRQLFDLGKRVFLLGAADGLPSGTELSPESMVPGNVHVLLR